MNLDFFIVDDDKGVRKVLRNIIFQHNLGDVVGEADNGIDAVKNIKDLNPDIVLVDLLLPGIDGISIVGAIKETNINTTFIMISEVSSKEMIAKAYTKGVEYFISKPVNVIEVISVINNVYEKVCMQEVIQSFEKAFKSMNLLKERTNMIDNTVVMDKDKIRKILSQLGIIGESGSNDIVEIILLINKQNHENRERLLEQKMSVLFEMLNNQYKNEYGIIYNVGVTEQRIRRAIMRALINIANLGIEDYGNDIFTKYSNTVFDFEEVRKQMNFTRGKSNYGGKISVKKFIEGVMVTVKNEM